MQLRLPLSLFVLLTLLRAACAAPNVFAEETATKTLLTAVLVDKTQAPVIDGKLDEPIWKRAREATGFSQIAPGNLVSKFPTHVRFLYDAKNLYIGFRCLQPQDTLKLTAAPDGEVWNDDCIELFLNPDLKNGLLQTLFPDDQHYHLIFNAAGTKFDELGNGGAASWNGDWEVKTSVQPDEWQAEVRIPFAAVSNKEVAPWPFQSWSLQIGRSLAKDGERATLFLPQGLYRNHAAFGYLVFVDNPQDESTVRWHIDKGNFVEPRLAKLKATVDAMETGANADDAVETMAGRVEGLSKEFEAIIPSSYSKLARADYFANIAKVEMDLRKLQERRVLTRLKALGNTSGIALAPHPPVKDAQLVKPDFLPALESIAQPVKVSVVPGQYQAASFVLWTNKAQSDVLVRTSDLKSDAKPKNTSQNGNRVPNKLPSLPRRGWGRFRGIGYAPASSKNRKNEAAARMKLHSVISIDGQAKPSSVPSSAVDVRWVKCWYQAGNNEVIRGPNILTPELLLKNPDMVTVDLKTEKNSTFITPEMEERGYPGDSLKLLPQKKLEAGSATQVWLTINVPQGTPAGTYRGSLTVTGAGKKLVSLPLEVTVLGFDLAPSMLEHAWYARTMWGGSRFGQTKERALAEVQNMVRHGVTQVGLIEESWELEKAVAMMRKGGLIVDKLYIVGDHGDAYFPATMDPAAAEKQAAKWVAASKACGMKEIYLYLQDEARDEVLKSERPVADAIHRAGAKTWVAGYADYFPTAGDFIDSTVQAFGIVPPELVTKVHGIGSKIFSYAHPQAGVERPEIYRRNYGLLLWQANYDGCFDWQWYQTFGPTNTRGYNPWDDFIAPAWRQQCMVYPTKDGVVDTIQWEGWREGVTDCRYMATLVREIASAKKRGRPTPAVAAAESWMNTLKASGEKGLGDLDGVRATMIRHIEACRAAR